MPDCKCQISNGMEHSDRFLGSYVASDVTYLAVPMLNKEVHFSNILAQLQVNTCFSFIKIAKLNFQNKYFQNTPIQKWKDF